MKGKESKVAALGVLALLLLVAGSVQAMPGVIDGISGPAFTLTAKSGYISTKEALAHAKKIAQGLFVAKTTGSSR